MSWDYSELSHAAKKFGGPEKYLETVKEFVRQETTKQINAKWMKFVIPFEILTVPFMIKGMADCGEWIIEKRNQLRQSLEISKQEADFAEEQILASIKDKDIDGELDSSP